MVVAFHGHLKNLPREFYHDPLVADDNGWTIAMIAAFNGHLKNLPREFRHNSIITNN